MRKLVLLAGFLLLSACAPTRPIFPPAANVQEIRQLPDGQWRITVRLQNYALRGMHFSQLDLQLSIDGQAAGHARTALDLDIAETNSDVAILTLQPAAAARKALLGDRDGNIAYALAGSVHAGPDAGDQRVFPLSHQGYLSPVPGLPDAWR